MTAKLSLRIAAIVMLLHDVGHIIGSLTWKKISDPTELDVINRMYSNKFPFMGAVKSTPLLSNHGKKTGTNSLLILSIQRI